MSQDTTARVLNNILVVLTEDEELFEKLARAILAFRLLAVLTSVFTFMYRVSRRLVGASLRLAQNERGRKGGRDESVIWKEAQ